MTTGTRKRARRGEGAALHTEILDAARQLLAETGSDEAVSVRAVAERVGVSTPSIYLHFADKDALIDAVCEAVFADLGQAMEAAAQGVADPFDALKERGLAYVRFALANPEHYRIVLMSRGNASNSAAHLLTTSTYQNLVESVRQCQQAGVFALESDPTELGTSLWAAAHGIAALLISNPTLVDPEHQMLVVEQVISAAGLGLALLQRIPQQAGDPCAADVVAGLDAALGPPQAYVGPVGPYDPTGPTPPCLDASPGTDRGRSPVTLGASMSGGPGGGIVRTDEVGQTDRRCRRRRRPVSAVVATASRTGQTAGCVPCS